MSEATFTFGIYEAGKLEFSTVAKSQDRNATQFLREFVRQQQKSPEHGTRFRRQMQIGLVSTNADNPISSADVRAKFAAKRAVACR